MQFRFNSMALASASASWKRLAIAGLVVLLTLIVFVWHDHLLPIVETLPRPIERVDPVVAPIVTYKNISCPSGLGQGQSKSHGSQSYTLTAPKVVALVFFGRRATVSILDCYLKRNLVKNGGLLDQVVWLQRTNNQEDLALLDRLLESEPEYSRQFIDTEKNGFAASYDRIDNSNMYIKIDDDIVFIEDDAIRSMVCTRLRRPDFYVVSANVVNQPMMSWIHWNLGAVRPYLPETKQEYPAPEPGHRVDWRASALPSWDGPSDIDGSSWKSPDDKKHRWLPVRGKSDHVLEKTPIMETQYDAWGNGLGRWQIAAQQHYSLFENLESHELWRYKFNTWEFHQLRMGIQFIAMMGHDINAAKPIAPDDEEHFSVTMPKKLGRSAVADGRGLVAHYSFGPQSGGIGTTDILDRYRSYAQENVCTGPMLWSPGT